MKNYTYLLFDWDGCLANTPPIWLKAYKKVFAEYGVYPTTEEIVKRAFGDWNAPLKFGIQDKEGFIQKLLQNVNRDLPNVDLNEGVFEVLKQLSKTNKKICILTSSRKEFVEPALKKQGIDSFFEFIIDMDDVSKHKPDPEIIYMALERIKGDKNEAIMIGDTDKDIVAAENAGIDSVLFYPRVNESVYSADSISALKPTHFISHFSQLLEIVLPNP